MVQGHQAPGNTDRETPRLQTTPLQFQQQQRRAQQRTEPAPFAGAPPGNAKPSRSRGAAERMWMGLRANELDRFFAQVYQYFERRGALNAILTDVVQLAMAAFLVAFSTLLLQCVDHTRIKHASGLADVLVEHCLSRIAPVPAVFLLAFWSWWTFELARVVARVPQTLRLRWFFQHLLGLDDGALQSATWPEVAQRLLRLQTEGPPYRRPTAAAWFCCPALTRHALDPHFLAHRIMRRENYVIALVNQRVLDLRVPTLLQLLGQTRERVARARAGFDLASDHGLDDGDVDGEETVLLPEAPPAESPEAPEDARDPANGRERPAWPLTATLEWSLSLVLLPLLFDSRGLLKPRVLDAAQHDALAKSLRQRLYAAGALHFILTPFVLPLLVLYGFFRYARAFHVQPDALLARTYTPLAQRVFREYNELPHFLAARLQQSLPAARLYVSQFRSEALVTAARLVAFISGSLASTLALLVLVDEDYRLDFQVTPSRSVAFYLALFGAVFAAAHSCVPSDDDAVPRDPARLLRLWTESTHYAPAAWQRLPARHRNVQRAFGRLYQYRLVLLAQELLSLLVAPLILLASLPRSADAVIRLVRNCTVHVDGLGLVCSFATFDFARHGAAPAGAPRHAPLASRDHKMESSFLAFRHAYGPQWAPPAGPQREAERFVALVDSALQQQRLGDVTEAAESPAGLSGLASPLRAFSRAEQPFPDAGESAVSIGAPGVSLNALGLVAVGDSAAADPPPALVEPSRGEPSRGDSAGRTAGVPRGCYSILGELYSA